MLICKNKKKLNVFIVFLLLIFVGPAAYYGVKYVLFCAQWFIESKNIYYMVWELRK